VPLLASPIPPWPRWLFCRAVCPGYFRRINIIIIIIKTLKKKNNIDNEKKEEHINIKNKDIKIKKKINSKIEK
jgi:hypothetical protein